jgi:hypothetical protein
VRSPGLRQVRRISRFAEDRTVLSVLAEPADGSSDPLAGLKFEVGSSGGIAREAFKALHPPGSVSVKKAETRRVETLELRSGDAGNHDLRDWLKAGGTILIVAAPEDEEVAAT